MKIAKMDKETRETYLQFAVTVLLLIFAFFLIVVHAPREPRAAATADTLGILIIGNIVAKWLTQGERQAAEKTAEKTAEKLQEVVATVAATNGAVTEHMQVEAESVEVSREPPLTEGS